MIAKHRNDGVTPVIATVLLLALIIVSITIVAAIVMGMVFTEQPKDVGLTVYPYVDTNLPSNSSSFANGRPAQGVSVILHSGKDVNHITELMVFIDDDFTFDPKYYIGGMGNHYTINSPSIGIPYKFRTQFLWVTGSIPNTLPEREAFVVVSAVFDDGISQVIYKGRVTLPASPS